MATTPFPVETFGGLDLRSDPTELGFNGAVNLLDVDLDRNGRLRTRSGSLKYNATTLAAAGYQQLYPYAGTAGDLIAIRNPSTGAQVDRVTATGVTTNLGSVAGAFPVTYSSAALGTPMSTVLYMTFVDSLAGVTIRKWDGTTLGTGTGKPTHVGTWPASNRLVQGGYYAAADAPISSTGTVTTVSGTPTLTLLTFRAHVGMLVTGAGIPAGTTIIEADSTVTMSANATASAAGVAITGWSGSRSTVFFSDAGAPDTYTANNFVTLRPGDGEVITAIISFRELLFVFKQSAAFVFYGESTDEDGNPVFNYRRIDLPDGISDPALVSQNTSMMFAVAGPDAVYYSTASGVYRTAGGIPELITRAVDPIFSLDPSVASNIRFSAVPASLAYEAQRLICSYTTASSATRQLVRSEATGAWTLWSLPSKAFAMFTPGSVAALNAESIMFPNGNNVSRMSPEFTTDDGVAIAWSYTSGMGTLADGARTAITLESRVWGTGTVTMKISNDSSAFDTGSALTLGTAPTLADAWQQIDREGVFWQHQLSGSASATVSRIAHYVSFVKPPGVQ